MLVFAAHPSERLKYILDQLLTHRLGIQYKITDSLDYFLKSSSLRIHYGTDIIEGCLNIPCVPLLFEDHIKSQELSVRTDPKWKFFMFPKPYEHVPDYQIETTHLHFDVFAAAFYLLSRYEEYLPGTRDEHNRFRPQDSIAFAHGFLETPLIDHWLIHLQAKLKKQYPELTFKEHHFRQINSIDVDFAYKYKGHGKIPLLKKFAGSLLNFKPDVNSLVAPPKDPYDTYDWMLSAASAKNVESIFFLLLADYGGNDKNIPPLSEEMKALAAKLSESYLCGIHPSYKAAINPRVYLYEHQIFEELCQNKALHSRHHFLKIKVPESYAQLELFGVTHDYTMAYSGLPGFRASTSQAFKLFDLHQNKTLDVWVYSPCVMDVTLRNSLAYNVPQAIFKIKQLKEAVQEVNGSFISIWHNSNFDPSQGWENWEQVYLSLFE